MKPDWTFKSIGPHSENVGASPGDELTKAGWGKGICECFSNCGMCCWVTWCQPCTVAQLYGLSGASGLSSKTSCQLVALVFILTFLLATLLTPVTQNIAGSLISLFVFLMSFYLVFEARRAIRKKNKIAGDDCSDCATSFFCMPCSICQMFTEKKIKACTSDPESVNYNGPCQHLEDKDTAV